MNHNDSPMIAVIGGSSCSQEESDLAEEVGHLLAENGAIVVCGGRGGIMEAVCRGAFTAGGTTVGILPGYDVDGGNPYLTIAIPTGLGDARNMIIVLSSQAVIAISGSYGTLSEVGYALTFRKPIISLLSWSASKSDGTVADIIEVHSPAEAVERALGTISGSSKGGT